MKAKELRDLTAEELGDKLRQVREEAFGLRMHQATSRLEKPSRIRELRRTAARIESVLNERKRGGQ